MYVNDIALANPSAGTNDLTLITPKSTNVCQETWVLEAVGATGARIRCVKARLEFKRAFVTPNFTTVQKNCDVKLDYRKFEILAGWKFNGLTVDPQGATFGNKGVNADFTRFLLPPEAAYGSAHNLQFALSALALAAGALLF